MTDAARDTEKGDNTVRDHDDHKKIIARPAGALQKTGDAFPAQTWGEVAQNHLRNEDVEMMVPSEDGKSKVPRMVGFLDGAISMPSDGTIVDDDFLRARAREASAGLPHSEPLEQLAKRLRGADDPEEELREASARLATLICEDGLPKELVVTVAAEALLARWQKKPEEKALSLIDAHDDVCAALSQFIESRGKEPKRPCFCSKEYSRMAKHLERELERRNSPVTFDGKKLYVGDQELLNDAFDAKVRETLDGCDLFEPDGYTRAWPTLHMIREVKSAYVHAHMRLPPRRRAGGAPVVDAPAAPLVAVLGAPVDRLLDMTFDDLRLDETFERGVHGRWTRSDEAWRAWSERCARDGVPPGEKSAFFRKLRAWGGAGIRRGQRGTPRTWGYEGLAIR